MTGTANRHQRIPAPLTPFLWRLPAADSWVPGYTSRWRTGRRVNLEGHKRIQASTLELRNLKRQKATYSVLQTSGIWRAFGKLRSGLILQVCKHRETSSTKSLALDGLIRFITVFTKARHQKPVYIIKKYLFVIHFNIIFQPTIRSTKLPFPSIFRLECLMHIKSLQCLLYSLPISFHLKLSFFFCEQIVATG